LSFGQTLSPYSCNGNQTGDRNENKKGLQFFETGRKKTRLFVQQVQ
jgi:hypothetical protein